MSTSVERARSVDQLVELVHRGARPQYLFFWGHTPKVAGAIDRSCLSNWFPAPFEIDSIQYNTTEHYMMAEKARLFGDAETREKIIAAKDPKKAKALGRQVRNFEEEVWVDNRFDIVRAGNLAKFRQNQQVRAFLLQTGSKVLVEASPHDRIWGIGWAQNDPSAEDPTRWRGLNLLGFALMDVREAVTE